MAYLSRIWLNPLRRQGRRFLSDPQALHAALLGGIPRQPVTERVLWRLDLDEPRRPGVVVLTESKPSWEHLVEQAGWPSADERDDPQALVRPYDALLARLASGQEYAFRLTANPVQSTRRPESLTKPQEKRAENGALPRSTRVGHRTAAHQLEWFTRRAASWGIELPTSSASESVGEDLPDVRISSRERRSFARGRSRVTLQVVTYEGRLIVRESESLREKLLLGMGPAKAYGCGLMTLAPLSAEAPV